MLVDNPILNSPFDEPTHYGEYREGQPVLKEGRRPAGYYLKARTRGSQAALLEEEFVPLEWVKAWRGRGYPGVTPITRRLPDHWNNPERERRLFFGSEPEYVDVYRVPFEVIPVQKKPVGRAEVQKVSTLVRALPEREHPEITFPPAGRLRL